MIYVFTKNRAQFESFLHEFHLRADYGRGDNRKGQCCPLHRPKQLYGIRNAIVLAWGTWRQHRDAAEIQDHCKVCDIPFLEVPDLRRARYMQEQRATWKPSVQW